MFGARIKNYLLEKSRVVKVAPMERGYHVFYFLLKGASDEMLRNLFLTKTDGSRYIWKDFRYLKAGGDLPDKHDIDGFNEIQDTLKQLQFSDSQINAIWRLIAAILHLGEIEFVNNSFDDPIEPSQPGKFKNEERVDIVAKLLGYTNPMQFRKIMLQTYSKLGRDEIWKPQGYKKCCENRDALAKQAYNNMFNWLVKMMNVTIEPDSFNDEGFGERAKTIGLLDIFGFENFKHNNFE